MRRARSSGMLGSPSSSGQAGIERMGNDLPLSNCTKLRSDDLQQIRTHMGAMVCPHELYVEGGQPPIDFRHNHAVLGSLSFNATDYGHPFGQVVVAVPPMEDLFVVEIALAGEARIGLGNDGLLLQAGEMFVMGGHCTTRHAIGQGFRNLSVKLARNELEALLARELGYRPGRLQFSPRPLRLEGAAASLAGMILTICEDIDEGRGGYAHPRAINAVADMLKRLLLASVPNNHSELFNGEGPGPAPFHVRRVEEFIRAYAHRPISLAELIAVSGVSGRSLHTGFRRFRDTTPMAYLKNHRLALARWALGQASDRPLSVTEVALNCGFTHLSRFARDYFTRYGEYPSTSLRRLQ